MCCLTFGQTVTRSCFPHLHASQRCSRGLPAGQYCLAQYQPVCSSLVLRPHPLPQDATELVSRLASFHYTAQTRPEKKHYAHYGLDLVNGVVRDNVEAGVLEPVLAKVKIVQVRPAD